MDLRAELHRLSVPDSAYSIGYDSNEAYCLIEETDGWHVYYSERGRRNGEHVFSSEAHAGGELLRRILADGAMSR
ncbi:hypothetical protein [Agromyces sp. NPDC049794]|uniref:hypothetical protein n=1 Tax=unclassified Agromyces TaxID=2639701 RepID=UPI003411A83C